MSGNDKYRILMGNEAIARAIVEQGCTVATSYPGTPASEILSSIARYQQEENLKIHVEWSVNEKAAYEVALSHSYLGGRAAVSMKQVGLNVASDPMLSSAYTGTIGGFLIVSADDPGPHSSQTEQDSRMLAMLAKVPVLDPVSPGNAMTLIKYGYELSEKYSIPVMLRPTTRICHARQKVTIGSIATLKRKAKFSRDPNRWAATPRFRLKLHQELNEKLGAISRERHLFPSMAVKNQTSSRHCIISSGVAYAYIYDLLSDLNLLNDVSLLQIPMPYPLPFKQVKNVIDSFEHILVVEESAPVIELQIGNRKKVQGRLDETIPPQGEITPDVLFPIINQFLKRPHRPPRVSKESGKRPTLCAGCGHRAAFFAIKKAMPKALYPGDIGCYTLGINLDAVDTCLCMGASINQAAGFYHSFQITGSESRSIVATIGDSTFIHSGITALINAVYNKARFILVILDNSTTAMTGNQPTAATGMLPDGTPGTSIALEQILSGCGIQFLRVIDPYDVPGFANLLKEAEQFTRGAQGGIAVVIARHPCLMNRDKFRPGEKQSVWVSEECTGCQYCIKNFECPALQFDAINKKVSIDGSLCTDCAVCMYVCPVNAIKTKGNT
jgi:indolepyruvate ferredoxin oxidoreductase alpha subunit